MIVNPIPVGLGFGAKKHAAIKEKTAGRYQYDNDTRPTGMGLRYQSFPKNLCYWLAENIPMIEG